MSVFKQSILKKKKNKQKQNQTKMSDFKQSILITKTKSEFCQSLS
jgi:hypothetical protein